MKITGDGPSDDLLDGGGGHTVEIGPPLVPFLGIAGERHHAVTDGVARCLVARGRQQNEERGDLSRRQALTVDLGLHQAGGEVVAGMSPAVPRRDAWRTRRVRRPAAIDVVGFAGHFVVADTQHHRRPVEDLCLVFFRDAHHVADDLQRQQAGSLGDEVGLAVGMVGDHVRRRSCAPGRARCPRCGPPPWA